MKWQGGILTHSTARKAPMRNAASARKRNARVDKTESCAKRCVIVCLGYWDGATRTSGMIYRRKVEYGLDLFNGIDA